MPSKSYVPLKPLATVTFPDVVALLLDLATKTFAFVTELTGNLPFNAPPEVNVKSKLSPALIA